MKHISILLFLLFAITTVSHAQQSEITGIWQLSKVIAEGETYDNLKAIYIFEDGGLLKAARSAEGDLIDAGKWEFDEKQNTLIMSSTLDKDFNGNATVTKLTDNELIYEKDNALLHFNRLTAADLKPEKKNTAVAISPPRLDFTEADFFDENGEYKYYDDEQKLPWQDINAMLMSLENVRHLVYKYSKLDENTGTFDDKTLTADVTSNFSEQTLSIDFIFYGFDRYNLPEDVAMPSNEEYTNLLYPEEDNTFRIVGTEQISSPAGTFDCTVVEVVLSFETRKKLWMINDKPGIYAKIITDKPGKFGQYAVFELQEIQLVE